MEVKSVVNSSAGWGGNFPLVLQRNRHINRGNVWGLLNSGDEDCVQGLGVRIETSVSVGLCVNGSGFVQSHSYFANDRHDLSSERVPGQDRTVTVKQLTSDIEHQMGLDTRTYWLTDWPTDRQSQRDSEADPARSHCELNRIKLYKK
jgi:hypothetical protein